MQVFDKTDSYHDRRAGQSEKEDRLKKVHDKVSEEEHDADSTVR
jgi:hypothetical protein